MCTTITNSSASKLIVVKSNPHCKLRELLVHANKRRGLDVGAAVARVNVHPRQLGCLQDGGQHLRAAHGRVGAFENVEKGAHCPQHL